MADDFVSAQDLINAKRDINDLGKIVNDPAEPGVVQTRFGGPVKTIRRVINEILTTPPQAWIDAIMGAGLSYNNKGDPGGNIMAIGLFVNAAALNIPNGTDAVRTSGYGFKGEGIADYFADAAVDAAFVAANPRTSFISANGRGFRLVQGFLYDVRKFGARCNGVADDSAAILAANAMAGDGLLEFPGICAVTNAIMITAPIADTIEQIFTLGALVTIDTTQPVRPEWFGIQNRGCVDAAIRCLPQPKGGVVKLEVASYPPNDHAYTGATADARYMDRQNIKIVGAQMPRFAPDCKSLVGGSILQGLFIAYADGFEISNVGFDSGRTVSDTLMGGVEWDGLVITYPSQQLKDAAALRRSVRLHNVIALCARPSSLVHAIIAGEGYQDVQCSGEVIGCYGVHGIVIKCTKVRAASFASYLNNFENVIIKSDVQVTARSGSVQIGRIVGDNLNGPPGTFPYELADPVNSATLYFHVQSASIDGVQIGEVSGIGARATIAVGWGGDYVLSSVDIGRVYSDQGGVRERLQALHPDNPGLSGALIAAVNIEDGGAQGTGSIHRFHIDSIDARNCDTATRGAYHRNASLLDRVSIGRLSGVNVGRMVHIRDTAYMDIQHVQAASVGTSIYLIEGTPSLKVGLLTKDGPIAATYEGLVPAVGADWVNLPGNDPFGISLGGGETVLHGLVQPKQTSLKVAQMPQWAWPESVKRFICQGRNGDGMTFVDVAVATDGGVYINEVGGGYANCTEWLSLEGCRW